MAQKGNQEGGDDMVLFAIAVVIVLGMFWFIFKQAEPWFNAAMGYAAWIHVLPFSEATRWVPALSDIPFIGGWLFRPAELVRAYLEKGGFAYMGINNADRMKVLTGSGRCAMLLYAPLLFWAATRGSNYRVDQTFKKLHSLESLIKANTKKWPGMLMVADKNPRDMNDLTAKQAVDAAAKVFAKPAPKEAGKLINSGAVDIRADSYMRSATPEEWLLMKGINWNTEEYERIKADMFQQKDAAWAMPDMWNDVSIESISEVLESQLTRRWTKIEDLSPAMRSLFAVFILFYDGGKTVEKANELMSELLILGAWAQSKNLSMDEVVSAEDGFMAKVDKLIASDNGKRMNAICAQHAWLESALPTALKTCREGRGVLAPASLLWMKRYNRPWWYLINNTGSEAMMIECAGAMAHNKSEVQMGMPIVRPCVWQAAKALHQDYLDLDPERVKRREEDRERRRKLSETLSMISTQVESAEKRGAYDEKWEGE